jgi:ribonuclease BN (tRNA processing enzyme)
MSRWTCIRLVAILLGAVSLSASKAAPHRPAPQRSALLSVVVLGSGGPGATGRAGTCFLVELDGTPRVLVDAGPGSFARLGETGLSLARTDVVLLTHLHADHAGELPGLFKARAVEVRAPITFHVFGPGGHKGLGDDASFPSTRRFIDLLFGPDGAFAYLPDFAGQMSFDVKDLPIDPKGVRQPAVIYREAGPGGGRGGELVIRAIPGHHRDAPAEIYRIDYGGKSVVFSGDIDAQGHDNLKTLAAGADLLVFDTVVLDPPQSPPILYTLHTPPGDIGRIAKASGVRALLLAHLSPVIDQNRAEVAASIRKSFAGPVRFAVDRMKVEP